MTRTAETGVFRDKGKALVKLRANMAARGVNTLRASFPETEDFLPLPHTILRIAEETQSVGWVERCTPLFRPGLLGKNYQEELTRVINVFKKTIPCSFVDMLSLDSTDHQIKPTCRTLEVLEMTAQTQPVSDIIIAPVQFGQEYAGKSMDWVSSQYSVFSHEFGLRLIDVLLSLIAYPERFHLSLMIDCPGDICTVGGVPDHSPCIQWNENSCVLTYRPRYEKHPHFGSWSGCLPTV